MMKPEKKKQQTPEDEDIPLSSNMISRLQGLNPKTDETTKKAVVSENKPDSEKEEETEPPKKEIVAEPKAKTDIIKKRQPKAVTDTQNKASGDKQFNFKLERETRKAFLKLVFEGKMIAEDNDGKLSNTDMLEFMIHLATELLDKDEDTFAKKLIKFFKNRG